MITAEEEKYLETLKGALLGENISFHNKNQQESVVNASVKSGTTGLLYNVIGSFEDENCVSIITEKARVNSLRYYSLLMLTTHVYTLLKNEGFECCILKGISVANMYPTPEYRAFGDVDIYMKNEQEAESASKYLTDFGFIIDEKQESLHHVSLTHMSGIAVEIHYSMMMPFDNDDANLFINSVFQDISYQFDEITVFGTKMSVLPNSKQAFQLLVHMLHHYLTSGFGVKFLCDWTVFWNNSKDRGVIKEYCEYADRCKIRGFSDVVTAICFKYLGLENSIAELIISDKYRDSVENGEEIALFLREIIDSGQFGEKAQGRLVTARKASAWGLFAEFHHQVRNYYPKMSHIWGILPILWIICFFRFIRNNKKVRNISTVSVIKSAYLRGRLTERLSIWER